jgi:hypothetical protein
MVHQVRTISLATQQQLTADRQVSDALVGTTDAMRQVAAAMFDLGQRVRSLQQRLDELTPGSTTVAARQRDRTRVDLLHPGPGARSNGEMDHEVIVTPEHVGVP